MTLTEHSEQVHSRVEPRRGGSICAAVCSALLLAIVACTDDVDEAQNQPVDVPLTSIDATKIDDVEDLGEKLSCDPLIPLDEMADAMPFSGAAMAGVACGMGATRIHIWERAVPDQTRPEAGSVEEIDRVLRTAVSPPECQSWVLITPRWFVVADDQQVLNDLSNPLGGRLRPLMQASPRVSYADAPGCV